MKIPLLIRFGSTAPLSKLIAQWDLRWEHISADNRDTEDEQVDFEIYLSLYLPVLASDPWVVYIPDFEDVAKLYLSEQRDGDVFGDLMGKRSTHARAVVSVCRLSLLSTEELS